MSEANEKRPLAALFKESGISYNNSEGEHSDKLTGCRTMDLFDLELQSMITAADNETEEMSVIMLDIDRFKEINDKYGNEVGDAVLVTVAGYLKPFFDRGHYVYRYAGDCFFIVMRKTEKEQAFLQIEEIRRALGSTLWEAPNAQGFRITISAGVAAFRTDGTTVTDLVRMVTSALFRAKTDGRDRVCLAREEKLVTKTAHYTTDQLQRLSNLAKSRGFSDAMLLREALDDLLRKYSDTGKAPNGRTVMIVDDAAFMRTTLRSMLQNEGFTVTAEAENGASGAQKYNANPTDCVLLDLAMPESDGFEFLQKIKKQARTRILVISAIAKPEMVIKAIELGADAFMPKPFKEETLQSKMTRLVGGPLLTSDKIDEYSAYCEKNNLFSDGAMPVMTQEQIDEMAGQGEKSTAAGSDALQRLTQSAAPLA